MHKLGEEANATQRFEQALLAQLKAIILTVSCNKLQQAWGGVRQTATEYHDLLAKNKSN
jgi:hypothetical protein